MKMKKILALLLVMAMVVTIAPIGTLAEEIGDAIGTSESGESGTGGGEDAGANDGNSGGDANTGGDGGDANTGDNGDDANTGDGGDDANTGDDGDDANTGDDGDDANTGDEGDDANTGGDGDDANIGGDGDDANTGDDGDDANTGDDGDDANIGEDDDNDGEDAEEIGTPGDQDALLEALIERLSELDTLTEIWAALRELTQAEWGLLELWLDAEAYGQLWDLAQLSTPPQEHPNEVFYVTEGEDEDAPVPFTNVAPLLPPVAGAVPQMMMRSMGIMAAPTSGTSDVPGLQLSKEAEWVDDAVKITLEAYVTGEYQYQEVKSPVDIVLVLDESGSMDYSFSTRPEYQYATYKGTFNGAYNHSDLYSKNANGEWCKVIVTKTNKETSWFTTTWLFTFTREGESTHFYQGRHSESSNLNQSSFLNQGTTIDNLYTKTLVNVNITRRQALQEAATHFVSQVRADNATLGLNPGETGHRIAIIGFSSTNNTSIKQSLTACTNSNINTVIDNLAASGATDTGTGMELAVNVLNGANNGVTPPGQKRHRVVIMFTDGEPTTQNDFSTAVANRAISAANTLKKSADAGGLGAAVYTIGVFPGANVNGTDNPNKFMNYTSSNYPNATSMTSPGSGNSNKGFYLVAANSAQLESIFEGLADSIETGNPGQTGLDETTILKDVISPYFQLETGNLATDVKVYTANCTGQNTNGYTFGAKTPYSGATVSQSGNALSVTGFDYSGNFVAQKGNTFSGKKLIVELWVKPIDSFFGGNQVPTNTSDSGIYKGSTLQEDFEVPTVDVPLNYTLAAEDQTIYLGGDAPVSGMFENLPAIDSIKNNDYVDLLFTVKRGTEIIGSYTVPSTANAYTLLDAMVSPEDCTDYTVEYEVQPIYGGTYQKTDGSITPTVHVLKPTINTQDAWSDYNGLVDLTQCVLLGENNANVTWSDGTTGHSSIPAALGTQPMLNAADFTFALFGGADVTGTEYTAIEEPQFQIKTIKINGKQFGGAHFTLGNNHNDATAATGAHHFTVHLNRFDFTLTKLVIGKNHIYPQDFIFQVQYGDAIYPISIGSGGGSKTIKGLLYGQGTTVTVTEKTDWSWRYGTNSAAQSVTVTGNEVSYGQAPTLTAPAPITITNTLNKDKWLSGTARVDNRFGGQTS